MQAVIGACIFAVVCIFGLLFGYSMARKERSALSAFSNFVVGFLFVVVVLYIGLGLIGGLFWVIAEFGIYMRNILIWLIEAVLYPFHWLGM